jgi:hypothetical protein
MPQFKHFIQCSHASEDNSINLIYYATDSQSVRLGAHDQILAVHGQLQDEAMGHLP